MYLFCDDVIFFILKFSTLSLKNISSVRLMARSSKKNLSTVLPPPGISPLHRVMSVCYSREFNVIYVLINPHVVWLYTTRLLFILILYTLKLDLRYLKSVINFYYIDYKYQI